MLKHGWGRKRFGFANLGLGVEWDSVELKFRCKHCFGMAVGDPHHPEGVAVCSCGRSVEPTPLQVETARRYLRAIPADDAP